MPDQEQRRQASSLRTPLNSDGNDSTKALPSAPDGGFGWVVVAASFAMGFIVDGCLFTFGIMTMEFVDHFQTNKMTIALAGSVMNGVYLSVGPIVSGLCNTLGCKAVAVSGSVVAALGFVTCIFSSNVAVLIVTYGALAGVGFGMMHLPSIVMVGFYFTTRRAFATGIAMCGSGIGAFVFAPVIQLLLGVYDWRGAQLILAGIVLQGCVLGLLFRSLGSDDRKNHQSKNLENCLVDESKLSPNLANHSTHDASNDSPERYDALPPGDRELLKPNSVLRKDLLYSGSLASLPEYNSRDDVSRRVSTRNVASREVERLGVEEKSMARRCCYTCMKFLNFSLLKRLPFLSYCCSCFLVMAGFFIPFMFLPELAVSQGLSRNSAALLLSIIGIANTVGRVICGWVSDRPWANCLVVNISALIMGGAALALVPAFRASYALLCVSAALFGLSIAVFASLRSIILVELLGLDELTNAFGLVTMFQGLSTFIGNPMAGAIYDSTGNFDTLFYVAGALLILAGLACIPCRRLAAARVLELELELDEPHI